MKLFVFLILVNMILHPGLIIDFSKSSPIQWKVINDDVMGGRSKSKLKIKDGIATFTGRVSTKNNGGFVSLRCGYSRYDLSIYDSVEIRFRSTGEVFALSLETEQPWYAPKYRAELTPDPDGWTTIKIPLKSFAEYRIGEATGEMVSKDDLAQVIRMGFINTTKNLEPFTLELDYMKFH